MCVHVCNVCMLQCTFYCTSIMSSVQLLVLCCSFNCQMSHLFHRMCRYTQAHSYIGKHPAGRCSWLLSLPCRGCWHIHLCLQQEQQFVSFLAAYSALKSSINFNVYTMGTILCLYDDLFNQSLLEHYNHTNTRVYT